MAAKIAKPTAPKKPTAPSGSSSSFGTPSKNAGTITPNRQTGGTFGKTGGSGGGSPTNPYNPGGGSGGGGPMMGPVGGGIDTLAVSSGVPTEEDYLAGDGTYQATLSALARQLQSFQADVDTQRGTRKLDYDKSLKDLGYSAAPAAGGGNWNWDDVLTASGRAYQNNSNDYASRGMLQSQAYADSINNLQRSLMDQFNGIDQTNTQFNTDLDRQVTKAQDENTSAAQQARAEAILRRAAQYGFGV